ncbi:uncharacterized protein MELLADRAFT_76996 [Melampsora larici-populina 98AG31]|uniref:SEC7 domain-containing protein n=1 Tax=Melampsora larici-populina (strain 98AG31 / pathotype 3-4-7) TaxID=747676 RepID=F4RC56_MELLP|nr:uncharacterized protein MELLADRAFT_76996 [Melampsora larici-populina 98AG31]EGG10223.1 hypothetical protein MELLADRAFT_76996 [Melampsora larici-populina 98AG31]
MLVENPSIHQLEVLDDRFGNQKSDVSEVDQENKKLKSLKSDSNYHRFDNLRRAKSTSNFISSHSPSPPLHQHSSFKSSFKSSSNSLKSLKSILTIHSSTDHHLQKSNSTSTSPNASSYKKSNLIHKLIRSASSRLHHQADMSSHSDHFKSQLHSPILLSPPSQRSCSASTSSAHTAFVTVPNSPSTDLQSTFLNSEPVSPSFSPSPQRHLPGTLSLLEEIRPYSNIPNLTQISQIASEHALERDCKYESNTRNATQSPTLQDTQTINSPLAHLSDSGSPHSLQKLSTTTMEASSSPQTTMEQIKNKNHHINSQAGRPQSPLNDPQKSALIPSAEKKESSSVFDHDSTGVIVVNQSRAGSIDALDRPSSRSSKLYHTEAVSRSGPSTLADPLSRNSSSQGRPSPSTSKSLEDMSNRKSSISALPDHFQSFKSLMNRRTSVSSRISNSAQPQPDMTSPHPTTELPLASSSSPPKIRKSRTVAKLVGRIGKRLRPKTKTQDVRGNSANESHYRPHSLLPTKATEASSETGCGDLTSSTAPEFSDSRVVESDMSFEKVTPVPLSPVSEPKPQAEGLQDSSENPVSTPQSSSFGKVRPLPTPKPNLRSARKYDLESDPDSDMENDTRPQTKISPRPFKNLSHLNLSSIVDEFQESELVYQLPALPSPISPLCSLFTDPGRFDHEKPKRPPTSPGYAHLIATSQICDPKGKARMVHSVELTRLPTTDKGKVLASNSVDLDISSRPAVNRVSMEAYRSIDPSSALSSTSSQPTTLFGHHSDQSEVETPASHISHEDNLNLPRTRISLHPRSSLRLASSPTTISTAIPVNSDQVTTSLHRQKSASGTPRPPSSGTPDLPRALSASVDNITQSTAQKEIFPLSSSAHSRSMEVTPWDYQDIPMRSTDGSLDHSQRLFPNGPSTSLLTSPKQESSRQRASTLFFGTLPGLKSSTRPTITGQHTVYNRPTKLSGSLDGQNRQPSVRNDLPFVQRCKSESRREMYLHVNASVSTTSSLGLYLNLRRTTIPKSSNSPSRPTQLLQTFTAPITLNHLPLKVSPSSPPSDQKDEDHSASIPRIHSPALLTAQPSSLWRSHSVSVPRKSSLYGDPSPTTTSTNPSHRFSRMITRSQSTANLGSTPSNLLTSNPVNPSKRTGSCHDSPSRLKKPLSTDHELRRRPMTAGPSTISRGTAPMKGFLVELPVKLKLLDRNGEERTEDYLERLGETLEKSMIVSALAASPDPFHLSAIITYLDSFEFAHDPIDLALRKLLMTISLPKETQQIDRVMEAFAKRYVTCNPKLFSSSDQVYILAFSIIMLHTDAFNKHNRGKMSRADYVKNTRMDGVPSEVLEYIYDNVTYTPFVFVGEDRDITGQKLEVPAESSISTSFFNLGSSTNSNSGGGSLRENKKQTHDPYLMISRGLTHQFRLDLETLIPSRNPFSFTGSVSYLDTKKLRKSFTFSPLIQIINTSKSNSMMNKLVSEVSNEDGLIGIDESLMINLKAVKVGLVFRKESGDGDHHQSNGLIKNVTAKKWKEWCVILTRSQLLFMKDTTLVDELQQSFYEATRMNADNQDEQLVVRITGLKPDSVFSLEDGIALLDLLILGKEQQQQQQYLIEVADENEMNSWITHINFGATYKSTDLPFRTWQLSDQVSSNPLSHSTSSIGANSILLRKSRGSTSSSFGGRSVGYPAEEEELMEGRKSRSRRASDSMNGSLKSRSFNRRGSLVHQGGRADTPERLNRNGNGNGNEPLTPGSGGGSLNVARYEMVKNKIKEIEKEIIKAKVELNEDLRIARNLAVLTPFQISNKNRLQLSILPLSDRIRVLRYNLSKLICYREVLVRDNLLDKANLMNPSIKSPSIDQHRDKEEPTEEACTPKSSGLPLTLGRTITTTTTTTTTTTNGLITEEIESDKINGSQNDQMNENEDENRIGSPITAEHLRTNHVSEVEVIVENEVKGIIPEAESKRSYTPSSIKSPSSSIKIVTSGRRQSSSSSDHHSSIKSSSKKSPGLGDESGWGSPLKKKNTWNVKGLNGIKTHLAHRPATANTFQSTSGAGSGATNGVGRIAVTDQSKRLTQAWGLP